MTEYSINLRTLVENHKTSTALGGSPTGKTTGLNSTQIKMDEIQDRMRRFAESYYTSDELNKAYPVHDYQASINKVHKQLAPTGEEVFNV
jgi:hypothetical protein